MITVSLFPVMLLQNSSPRVRFITTRHQSCDDLLINEVTAEDRLKSRTACQRTKIFDGYSQAILQDLLLVCVRRGVWLLP